VAPQIVVVGSLNTDVVAKVQRLPSPGETIQSTSLATFPGGKGANQAVAAAASGASVAMIGRVGADEAGETLLHSLQKHGVDTHAVLRTNVPTGTAYIMTDAAGENSIVLSQGANGELAPADMDQWVDLIRDASMVLTQLEIPLETVERTAELCNEFGVPLMLDPAPAQQLPASLLKRVAWITPNEIETSMLLGQQSPSWDGDAARAASILNLGCHWVVLKLGERGAYLAGKSGWSLARPAFPVTAVDTTAAGDVFNGAFAARLVVGESVEASAKYAAAAAALSVTCAGAQRSMPNRAEVDALLATGLLGGAN
jgi:ribokinase